MVHRSQQARGRVWSIGRRPDQCQPIGMQRILAFVRQHGLVAGQFLIGAERPIGQMRKGIEPMDRDDQQCDGVSPYVASHMMRRFVRQHEADLFARKRYRQIGRQENTPPEQAGRTGARYRRAQQHRDASCTRELPGAALGHTEKAMIAGQLPEQEQHGTGSPAEQQQTRQTG